MLKLVLSRLFYEIIEDIVGLDHRIIQAKRHVQPDQVTVTRYLQEQVKLLKAQVVDELDDLGQLLSDQDVPDDDCHRYLSVVLPKFNTTVRQLTDALYQIDQRIIEAESIQLIESLGLSKLVSVEKSSVVVVPIANREGVYLEDRHLMKFDDQWSIVQDLPLLSINNPLQWFGLTDYFIQAFATKTAQLHALIDELQSGEFPVDMLCPLFNLRLLGPSYYAYYVLQSLKEGYQPWFWIVEPLLFQGLNRFGFINKDLVILHQSLEKAKAYVEDGTEDNDELELSDKDREALLSVTEKIIPDPLAFVEKQYQRAQLLQDRLENGMLISAVPMLMNPVQLHDTVLNHTEDEPVYPLLKELKESPSKPVEILNAGMLYKLDQGANWIRYAMNLPEPQDFWPHIEEKILSLSDVLAKSIETAQVFNVLNDDGYDPALSRVKSTLQSLRLQEPSAR